MLKNVLKILRWALRILVILVAVLALAVGGAVLWARSAPGQRWILTHVLSAAQPREGSLHIDGLHTDLWTYLRLEGVSIRDRLGTELVGLDLLDASLDITILRRAVTVPALTVDGLHADLSMTNDGLDIAGLWTDPEAPRPEHDEPYDGLPVDLYLENIAINATELAVVAGDQVRGLSDVRLRGGVRFEGDRVLVRALTLDAAQTLPDLGALALRADLVYDAEQLRFDTLDLTVGAQRASITGGLGALSSDEPTAGVHIAALHLDPDVLPWALPVHGGFDVSGDLTGSVDAPILALLILTPGGPVQVDASLDQRPARPTWTATIEASGLAIQDFVAHLDPTVVSARLHASGTGAEWPDDLDAHITLSASAPTAAFVGSAEIQGTVDVSKGVAQVKNLDVSTHTGSIRADGEVDLIASNANATVRAANVILGDLARFGVTGLKGTARFEGTLDGDWSGENPVANLEGTLTGDALRYQGSTGVANLSGPIALHLKDTIATFSTDLRADGVSASSARLSRASLKAEGSAQGGAMNLKAKLQAYNLRASQASVRSLLANATVHRSARGALATRVRFTTTEVRSGDLHGDHGAGHLSLVGDRLDASVDLTDQARAVIGLDANGDLRTRHFEIPRLLLSPTPDQTWTGEGVQRVTIVSDGVEDLWIKVVSQDAALAAEGRLHTRGDVAMTLSVDNFALGMLGSFVPSLKGYAGIVNVKGALGGDFREVVLSGDANVADLAVPGQVHGVDARLVLLGLGETLRVEAAISTKLREGGTIATLVGAVPVSLDLRQPSFLSSGPLNLKLEVPQGTSELWNAVLDAGQVPTMRGGASLEVTGTALQPELRAVATVEMPAAYKKEDWVGFDLDASTLRERLTVNATMRQGEVRQAEVVGTASVLVDRVANALFNGSGAGPVVDLKDPTSWVDDLDFVLRPLDLSIQSLAAFFAVPDGVHGQIEGELHLTGSPRAPVIDGALAVHEARLNEVEVSPATLAFAPSEGGYDVKAELGFNPQGGLRIDGHVPLDLSATGPMADQMKRAGLKMTLSGEGVPLDAIAALWPDMQQASGVLQLSGDVSGSIAEPVPHLLARTDDARFELTSTGVAYDQIHLDLKVDPAEASLQELHVRTSVPGTDPDRGAQGTVQADLSAKLNGTTLGDWTGRLVLDRPLLSATEDALVRLSSGEVKLKGSPPNIEVVGSIAVEEARIRLDERFFSGPRNKTLPPWMQVHRGVEVAGQEAAPAQELAAETSKIPDWLAMTFGIDLSRNVFLHAEMPLDSSVGNVLGSFATLTIDTQADGELKIDAHDGVLSVVGQVLPLQGTTVLFGKPFEISDDSIISFTGRDFNSPVLDLRATYDTREYGDVEAHISGIPDALKVDLSSSEYSSQDDVISLLLTGKPASEMAAGEGGSEGAAGSAALSMLVNTLATQGAQTAALFVTPDLLVIGADNARVGKRIGSRVFVIFELDNTADDIKTSYLVLTVELALGGPWEGEFIHGTAGEDSVGVNWTKRY